MARAREPRVQFNFRLPRAVLQHLDKRFDKTGVEKQLQALAALVGFELMGELTRASMITFAKRVSEGEVEWKAIVDLARTMSLPEPDREGLVKALNSLANPARSKPATRRQA